MSKKRSRYLRKVPHFVEAKLHSLGDGFNVAVVKRIPAVDVQNGQYTHVGLTWENNQFAVKPPCVLSSAQGKYARFNAEGQEIVRRDLPKIEKSITFTNPRLFGIPGNVCQITQIRQVYQREPLSPRRHVIETSVLLGKEDTCIALFGIGGHSLARHRIPNASFSSL